MAGTFRNVWLHVWDKNYPQTIVELLEPIYYSLKQFASEMFYFLQMPVYALIAFGVSKFYLVFFHFQLFACNLCRVHSLEVVALRFSFRLQCYSLATIGYRVATFNDCVEASESLKQVRSWNFL